MSESAMQVDHTAPAAPETAEATPPAMTKSALKRQRRQEAWQANKLARRAAEKDKRKQKQQQTRDLVAQGLIEKPTDSPTQRKKQKRREIAKEKEPHPATLCIDMDFDKLMSDKEIKSMASQLAYCYSANRLGSHPFPLLVTSFVGRIRKAYENRQDWKSWKGVEWWEEPLEQLYEGVPDDFEPEQQAQQTKADEAVFAAEEAAVATGPEPEPEHAATNTTREEEEPDPVPSTSSGGNLTVEAESSTDPTSTTTPTVSLGALAGHARSRAARSTVVYLTGDSPNVLTSLEPGHTYVLGGIVDRNRYKLLCLDKAEKLGVRHAQLPIGDALPEMKTRKVLTVNQVVEILVKWVDLGQQPGAEGWAEALRTVMPSRKFDAEGKKKRREAKRNGASGDGGAAGDEDEDEGDASDGEDDGEGVYIARDDDQEEGDQDDQEGGAAPASAPTATSPAPASSEAASTTATVAGPSNRGTAGHEEVPATAAKP